MTIPITNIVIFHESKPGPFIRSGDSVYPEWAPTGKKKEESEQFIRSVLGKKKRKVKKTIR